MFWDTGYSNSANIDALLNKEDCTLKELLDDEDILQECKSQNQKLVKFLNRPEIVQELVSLIATEPPADLEEKQRFLYPNVACEILTSDVPSIKQRMVEDSNIMNKLYSFFEQEPPLNPLLASFICKTFGTLIMKKMEQDWFLYQTICLHVLEFIKSKDNFLDVMVHHFSTPVVMDLMLTMLNEVEDAKMKSNFLEWLNEKGLIEKMIDVLCVPTESEKHVIVAQFLIELIKTGRCNRQSDTEDRKSLPNPLLQRMEESQTTTRLIDAILCDTRTESGILSGLQVLLCLLENSIIQEPVSHTALQQIIDAEKEHHDEIVASLMSIIQPRVHQLYELLLNPPQRVSLSGEIREALTPALGNVRLQLCYLFTVLIETENSSIIEEICKTNFFNELLNLFKQYCWNNFLHNYVKKCLVYGVQAFDTIPNSTQLVISALQKHIVVDCKVADKLIDCWNENALSQQKGGRRLGYMGHLIEILSAINSTVSASDDFRALLESSFATITSGSGEQPTPLDLWNQIMNSNEEELTVQKRLLADCDPSERKEYGRDGLLGFPSNTDESENDTEDYYNYNSSMHNSVNGLIINDFNDDFNNDDDMDSNAKMFEGLCNQNQSAISFNTDNWEPTEDFFNQALTLKSVSFDGNEDEENNETEDIFTSTDPFESTTTGVDAIIGNNNISNSQLMFDYQNGAYEQPTDFLINFYASQCTNYPFTATTNIPSPYNPFHHHFLTHDGDVNSNNDNWANFNSSPDNFADFDSHFANMPPIGVESSETTIAPPSQDAPIPPSIENTEEQQVESQCFVATTQLIEISTAPPVREFQLGPNPSNEILPKCAPAPEDFEDEEFYSLREDSNDMSSLTDDIERKFNENTEVPDDDDDDFASADESSSKGNSEEDTNSNNGDQFLDCAISVGGEEGKAEENTEDTHEKVNGIENEEKKQILQESKQATLEASDENENEASTEILKVTEKLVQSTEKSIDSPVVPLENGSA